MIVIRDRDCLPVNGKAEGKPCTSGSSRMAAKGSQKDNCSFLTSQGKGSETTTSTGLLTIKTQIANSNSYLTPVSSSCHVILYQSHLQVISSIQAYISQVLCGQSCTRARNTERFNYECYHCPHLLSPSLPPPSPMLPPHEKRRNLTPWSILS